MFHTRMLVGMLIVGLLGLVSSCNEKKKSKKAKIKNEEVMKKDEPKEEEKPKVPDTNISQRIGKFKDEMKELGLPVEFKECNLDLLKEIVVTADMRRELYTRRASNHTYNADYNGIAREYENIAKVYEDRMDDNAEWLVNAASMYMRANDHDKALDLFRQAYNLRPQNLKVVQRYSIFLSTAKPGIRDFAFAERLANEAESLAKDENERNLVADAFAELAFAKFGLVPACEVLDEKASYSYAEERCREFKSKNSRYTIILLNKKFKRSIRPAWRETGIPEGEPSCLEQLSFVDNAAYTIYNKEKKPKDAAELIAKLLAYDMHYGDYIEYLSDYAEILLASGPENQEKAEKIYQLASKLDPNECYVYASYAAALAKVDPVKNKDRVKELNQQALRVCEMESRQCMFQVGLNYQKIKEFGEARKIGQEGMKLFPTFSFASLMKRQ